MKQFSKLATAFKAVCFAAGSLVVLQPTTAEAGELTIYAAIDGDKLSAISD